VTVALGTTSTPKGDEPMSVADELTKLVQLRDSGALTQEEFDQQRAILLAPPAVTPTVSWGPTSQAGPGMSCGRCGKPLSPARRGKCNHCGGAYADFPPRAPGTGEPAAAPSSGTAKPASGSRLKGCLGVVVIGVLVLIAYGAVNRPAGRSPSPGSTPAAGDAAADIPAEPAFAPVDLKGNGAKVAKFTIPETAAGIASITHKGAATSPSPRWRPTDRTTGYW
jgi:putative oligomerization/nucleic acid binding protein